MTIKVGDKIPSATLYRMGDKGPEAVTTDELFSKKKVVLFGIAGHDPIRPHPPRSRRFGVDDLRADDAQPGEQPRPRLRR